MNSVIVSGFPLCGKTYAYNHRDELDLSCIDIDSHVSYTEVDKYIDCVRSWKGRVKHILVSYAPPIREALMLNRLSFICVVPEFGDDTKREWFRRSASTQNFEGYLKSFEVSYDEGLSPKYVQIGHPLYTRYIQTYISDILDFIE